MNTGTDAGTNSGFVEELGTKESEVTVVCPLPYRLQSYDGGYIIPDTVIDIEPNVETVDPVRIELFWVNVSPTHPVDIRGYPTCFEIASD